MAVMQRQTLVIVRLTCSDGIEGIGEATTIGGLSYGEESPEGIKLAIDTYLAPALAGLDATNIHAAMQRLEKVARVNRFAKSALETALKDVERKPGIATLKRVSRSGLRQYRGKSELPKVMNGLGISIISTSKGIMTDAQARQLGVGGEVLCFVA
ncbi:hypothetical protein G6F24_016933 [Rhizopus arrhizus]|nr:hypothetical protein G6F24_016933 [Rhizopus arrhizus]